jgi:Family of unknown function (DUF6186)
MNATRAVTDAVWVALVIGAAGLVLAAHADHPRVARLSAVARSALRTRPAYVGALVVWMWAGWHFFAR